MTEKINGQGIGRVDATGTSRRPTRTEGSAAQGSRPASAGSPSADTVSLTSSALLLQRLEEILASVPVADAERVAAIKHAIASGSYRIDPDAIAEAMIRMDRELRRV